MIPCFWPQLRVVPHYLFLVFEHAHNEKNMMHVTQLLYVPLLQLNEALTLHLVSNLKLTYNKCCPHIMCSRLHNSIIEKNLQQPYQT